VPSVLLLTFAAILPKKGNEMTFGACVISVSKFPHCHVLKSESKLVQLLIYQQLQSHFVRYMRSVYHIKKF